jgi:hypothetical protein
MAKAGGGLKKAFAAIAVVGGVALCVFEIRALARGGNPGAWFWLIVAVLMVVLGVLELVAPARPPDGGPPMLGR